MAGFANGHLGASMITVGLIEGAAEATASVFKVFSGTLSDYLGKRKLLMILGSVLDSVGALIGPLLAVALYPNP